MKHEEMMRKIADAFDRFILAIGGNLDSRGAGNRDRHALVHFWRDIHTLDCEPYSDVAIETCMKEILQQPLSHTPGTYKIFREDGTEMSRKEYEEIQEWRKNESTDLIMKDRRNSSLQNKQSKKSQ